MAYDTDSLGVKGTATIIHERQEELDSILMETVPEEDYSSLAAFISKEFQRYKDARRSSGVEEEMFNSLRAFNGEYSPSDAAKIEEEGGSFIFMNLTATKCRAAASWVKDILLGKEDPFSIEPTPIPSLPVDIASKIEEAIQRKAEQLQQQAQEQIQQAQAQAQQQEQVPEQAMPDQMQAPQPPSGIDRVQEDLIEANQYARDIMDAVRDELMQEASHSIKRVETQIKDQFVEGYFKEALSDFIDDFVVFPSAIMKGPVITETKRIQWDNGQPVTAQDYNYLNKRVSPFDFYPSPESTCVNDGGLIEHIRITPAELYSFKMKPSYKDEAIDRILDSLSFDATSQQPDFDDSIENEKDDLEMRGTTSEKKNILHGLHFFGSAPAHILEQWGLELPTEPESDYQVYDVEAILVHGEVVKCVINDDPLHRKPYYAASWQRRPGAFWGRSLPDLMEDIQRMCNATARALANNMGLASGPQIEVYVDRLADDTQLESIYPFKIWQLTSDPTGAGGRAINFHQPTSNARELLEVYNTFEMKADEATGIPRYMYGSEKMAGAGATASGLSMLLESATKTVKEAIRHIDEGLIKPRVEYQFYWNMLENPIEGFNGDVQIVAKGSSTLTVKGAAQVRRNEFLQITANPFDMALVGKQGRAAILREIAKDLDLCSNIIPNNLVIKRLEEEEKANQQAAMEMEQQKGLAATKMQIEGQMQMAQGAQQIKAQEVSSKHEREVAKLQLDMQKMQSAQEQQVAKLQLELEKLMATVEQREMQNKRNVASTLEVASINSGRS